MLSLSPVLLLSFMPSAQIFPRSSGSIPIQKSKVTQNMVSEHFETLQSAAALCVRMLPSRRALICERIFEMEDHRVRHLCILSLTWRFIFILCPTESMSSIWNGHAVPTTCGRQNLRDGPRLLISDPEPHIARAHGCSYLGAALL